MKTYYKVVAKNGDSYVSGTSLGRIIGYTTYLLNNYVYCKDGRYFFVFDTLHNAQAFIKDYIGCSIFECECQGVENPKDLDLDWVNCNLLPNGTMFACGVKLTKEVVEEQSQPIVPGNILQNGNEVRYLVAHKNDKCKLVSLNTYGCLGYNLSSYQGKLELNKLNEFVKTKGQSPFKLIGHMNDYLK